MYGFEHENLRNIAAIVITIAYITSSFIIIISELKLSWFILPGKDEYIISAM